MPAEQPRPRGPALGVIVLPITWCNAACTYCFEQKDRVRMSLDQAQRVFERFRDYAADHPVGQITYYWQGGEALLMGAEWFDRMADRARAVFADTPLRITHTLQSNLLLYESSWAPTIRRVFDGRIGSSLDFPNQGRKAKGHTIEGFEAAWHERYLMARDDGLSVGVIALPNEASLAIGARRFYDHYYDELGIRSLQINFPFPGSASPGEAPVNPLDPERSDELAAFLVELFQIWVREGRAKGHLLSPFSGFLERVSALSPRRGSDHVPCIFGVNCSESFLSIAPDGRAGLCDCWVTAYPDHIMGNIYTEPLAALLNPANPIRRQYVDRLIGLVRGECGVCPHFDACYGGCPIRTYTVTGALDRRDPNCRAYQAVFAAALELAREI